MSDTPRISVEEYRKLVGAPPRSSVVVCDGNPGSSARVEHLYHHGARGKAHHALGRLPAGEMNKTEARFDREWIGPRKAAGEIVWSAFNAVKFRIAANRCWLTIDFLVKYADGHFEAIDVKGAKAITEEDAKVKMKVAAQAFPFVFMFAFPRPRKLGGGWLIQEVG